MPKKVTIKANRKYTCEYCGKPIRPGEKYEYNEAKYKAEPLRIHKKCAYIAEKLWGYILPDDDRMTQYDFQEGCYRLCRQHLCPRCNNQDKCHKLYCIDKPYEVLKIYKLVNSQRENWKLKKRKPNKKRKQIKWRIEKRKAKEGEKNDIQKKEGQSKQAKKNINVKCAERK